MKNINYELVLQAQEGNEDAVNYIYLKFKPLIIKKSKYAIMYATHHGVDIDDIIQEAYIGLEEAISNYSQDEDTSFYTFAMICIERQIVNYMRKINNTKDKLLNEAVSIDTSIENIIKDNINIENSVTLKEYKMQIINKVIPTLTDFEKKILDLKLHDYSLDEIKMMTKKDKKSIYNAIKRIKFKFKKISENDD